MMAWGCERSILYLEWCATTFVQGTHIRSTPVIPSEVEESLILATTSLAKIKDPSTRFGRSATLPARDDEGIWRKGFGKPVYAALDPRATHIQASFHVPILLAEKQFRREILRLLPKNEKKDVGLEVSCERSKDPVFGFTLCTR